MSLTYTPHPEAGEICPDFSLNDVFGKTVALKDFESSKALCVMFICNHCPYVKAVEDRLVALANNFDSKLVQFVAICSNDSKDHREDAPENLKVRALEKKYPFPYLVDEEQSVAKDFGAVCTPDFFLYDQNKKLFYRGRLDDSWKNPAQVTSQELKNAIQNILDLKPAPKEIFPSMGCSIKWKA